MIATLYANAPGPWPLREGVVHVWRFACQQDPGALAATLSPEEQHVASRFATRALRDAYIVQHAMLRGLLARYVDCAPDRIELARGARGKPYVVGRDLEVNLAHCDDVALLAVACGIAVGVDVERLDAGLDTHALGRIVLAPSEVALGGDRRGFLRVWCRKEACLKATGVGLLDDLTAVSVVAERVDVAGDVVYVQDLDVGTAHAAALATSVPCARVTGCARPDELETVRVSW